MPKTLIIIVGPTGTGKTELTIHLANFFNSEIISADSRQIYRELSIGTAVPTAKQLAQVKHHLVACKSIQNYYSAGIFEHEVLGILTKLFTKSNTAFLTGGSGMYIDAISRGIDGPNDIDNKIREKIELQYKNEGIESLRFDLKRLDPEYYAKVDLKNPKRIMKALEVCQHTGKTHTSFLKNKAKNRPFNIIKIGLERPREELYNRINQRAEQMLADGLLEEVKANAKFKNLNALNTVGYKEFYAYLAGDYDYQEAVRLFKRNSRRYAKRQITWFKKDTEIHWFPATEKEKIQQFISEQL